MRLTIPAGWFRFVLGSGPVSVGAVRRDAVPRRSTVGRAAPSSVDKRRRRSTGAVVESDWRRTRSISSSHCNAVAAARRPVSSLTGSVRPIGAALAPLWRRFGPSTTRPTFAKFHPRTSVFVMPIIGPLRHLDPLTLHLARGSPNTCITSRASHSIGRSETSSSPAVWNVPATLSDWLPRTYPRPPPPHTHTHTRALLNMYHPLKNIGLLYNSTQRVPLR